MNTRITLYSDDFSDYGWYHLCFDLGYIKYEYEQGNYHTNITEIIIEVGGSNAIVSD